MGHCYRDLRDEEGGRTRVYGKGYMEGKRQVEQRQAVEELIHWRKRKEIWARKTDGGKEGRGQQRPGTD